MKIDNEGTKRDAMGKIEMALIRKQSSDVALNRTVSILLRFVLYSLAGLILSNLIVTETAADGWNIFGKGRYGMNTNQEERQIIRLVDEKSDRDVIGVAWGPDGKSIATTELPMQVTIWDASTLSIRHKLNQGYKGGGHDNITFSPDRQYLASGLSTINVWKVADGTLKTTLVAPHVSPGIPQVIGVRSLRFSPDGKMLVVAYDGETQVVIAYRLADREIIWSYEPKRTLEPQRRGSPLITTPLAFTPDGKRVILGTRERGGDDVNLRTLCRILVLDAETGEFLRSIEDIHVMAPMALAISPDGKWVATGTSTGTKSQTNNFKTMQTVTVDNKDPVRIWNLETGKLVRELPVQSPVRYLVFSRDGKYLFGSKVEYKTHLSLAVWDVSSGKMLQEVRRNFEPMGLAVSPDGRQLAAACMDKLTIYEITPGK